MQDGPYSNLRISRAWYAACHLLRAIKVLFHLPAARLHQSNIFVKPTSLKLRGEGCGLWFLIRNSSFLIMKEIMQAQM